MHSVLATRNFSLRDKRMKCDNNVKCSYSSYSFLISFNVADGPSLSLTNMKSHRGKWNNVHSCYFIAKFNSHQPMHFLIQRCIIDFKLSLCSVCFLWVVTPPQLFLYTDPPHPVTHPPNGSCYFKPNSSSFYSHLPAYEDGIDRVFWNVGI